MKKHVLVALFFVVTSISLCGFAFYLINKAAPRPVDLLTIDRVSLQAIYYPPKNLESSPGTLLLLHEAYQDSHSWDDFSQAAQKKNYAVFTVDLRGHGHSGGEKTFDGAMDYDVDAALAWLQTCPDVDKERIAIVGASLGANLALRAGARHPEIKSVVLLSPRMSLWEIGIDEAAINYGSRPLLLIATEQDSYSAATVQKLGQQVRGKHKLQLGAGAEHGTRMMASHPELTSLMLNWLGETMP